MMICAVEEEISLYVCSLLLRNLRNSSAKPEALKTFANFAICFIFLAQTSKRVYFYEKETPAQVFSHEFCNIFNNIFFKEHLWTTASTWKRRLLIFLRYLIVFLNIIAEWQLHALLGDKQFWNRCS